MLSQSDKRNVVLQTACELLAERDRETRAHFAAGAYVEEKNRKKARARRFTYAHQNLADLMGDLETRGLEPNLLLEPLSEHIQEAIEYEPDLWELRLCARGLVFEPEAMVEWSWNCPPRPLTPTGSTPSAPVGRALSYSKETGSERT